MIEDPFRLTGSVIDGRYRVDAPIGEGGFGVVYRGHHLRFDHAIAIKCLKTPPHFTPDAQRLFFEKFREEGAMLSRLAAHPSIVRVFDFGLAPAGGGHVPYLVLEWIDGQPLDEWLAGRKLSEKDAIAALRPIVEAIAVAHGEGIVHRDLKPANVMMVSGKRGLGAKVLDFGVAKAIQEGEIATQQATRTASGFAAFSPAYGTPEQFWAKTYGATGPYTDVYALALLLVELVTGKPAYDGTEAGDFFMAATEEARPTPRARGAVVSDAFEAMCARALERVPQKRFYDAKELLAAMDAVAAGKAAPAPLAVPSTVPLDEPPPGVVGGSTGTEIAGLGAPGGTEVAGVGGGGAGTDPVTPGALDHLEWAAGPKPAGPVRDATTSPRDVSTAPRARPFIAAPPPPSARGAGAGWKIAGGVAALVVLGAAAGIFAMKAARTEESDAPAASVAPAGSSRAGGATDRGDDEARARAEASARQKAEAARLGEMITIEGGTFRIGTDEGHEFDRPAHTVTLATYEIDATEVTVAAYRACVRDGACTPATTATHYGPNAFEKNRWSRYCNYDKDDRPEHPLNCVETAQAEAFCRFANKRLPTEEEWEYAARSRGEARTYAWGDAAPDPTLLDGCDKTCGQLNAREGADHALLTLETDGWETTAPVGSFPLGDTKQHVHDMTGNVWEITASPYCPFSNPKCTQVERVLRGGGWRDGTALELRTTKRASFAANFSDNGDVGFRCARSPSPG